MRISSPEKLSEFKILILREKETEFFPNITSNSILFRWHLIGIYLQYHKEYLLWIVNERDLLNGVRSIRRCFLLMIHEEFQILVIRNGI